MAHGDSVRGRPSRTGPGCYDPQRHNDSDERYTPRYLIEWARSTMGGIDLDPASCELANSRLVEAEDWFGIEDDSLDQQWHGRVWMNPPWSYKQKLFIMKLLDELDYGHVDQYVVLAPLNLTSWTCAKICRFSKITFLEIGPHTRKDSLYFLTPSGDRVMAGGLQSCALFLGGPELDVKSVTSPPGNWMRAEFWV